MLSLGTSIWHHWLRQTCLSSEPWHIGHMFFHFPFFNVSDLSETNYMKQITWNCLLWNKLHENVTRMSLKISTAHCHLVTVKCISAVLPKIAFRTKTSLVWLFPTFPSNKQFSFMLSQVGRESKIISISKLMCSVWSHDPGAVWTADFWFFSLRIREETIQLIWHRGIRTDE